MHGTEDVAHYFDDKEDQLCITTTKMHVVKQRYPDATCFLSPMLDQAMVVLQPADS